mmetsp:Transcript_56599/g.115868  ORF Transcript_56599/g.115868 Transcript_56599/m.115868 type:complete len:129 (-) Transcript_56599:594-980(-)|eukprot:CAMPEP_0181326974 /NCGR_PEP_ID=MMETSP1101-20121128/21819_1 /TAXON_ID=46948 /ORGANISM="Rhodomonas abbreviata, Strain Caron Lab Isolate" /LENGTH=128 /DNA_ID=CAMNT_0023435533 /DNA_START=293 /DNA_END=679 /DNA_ORIENTATION=+
MACFEQSMMIESSQAPNNFAMEGMMMQCGVPAGSVQANNPNDHAMANMIEMMDGVSLSRHRAAMSMQTLEAQPEYAHVYMLGEDQWTGGCGGLPFDPDQHDDGTGCAFMQQMQWCIENDLSISVPFPV